MTPTQHEPSATTRVFSSLRVRNFRMYFTAQAVSVSGTWMQTVAQDLLVLQLTKSGTAVGITAALQFVPLLLGGAWSGLIADRVDRRRLLIAVQAAMAVQAVVLAGLVLSDAVTVEIVWLMSFLLGLCNMLSLPARQAFVHDLVGDRFLTNAVSLHSAVLNAGRVVGPALAGVTVAVWGTAPAFLLNAASYAFAIIVMSRMDRNRLRQGEPAARDSGQIRAGLAHAWRNPVLRETFILVSVVGALGYNFRVTVPLLGSKVFAQGPSTIGILFATMAFGACGAALFTASRRSPTRRLLWTTTLAFGAAMLLTAAAPSPAFAGVALLLVGGTGVSFMASANARLQLHADADMRGRVMALYVILVLGTTPIGGPIVGWIADTLGTRPAIALGGIAPLVAVAAMWLSGCRGRIARDAQDIETATRPV
ncbi:MAG: MFS transporter [Acidimicrobiia bacterium]|nr:MFS transporter [Acidimicrobiia bacterium]